MIKDMFRFYPHQPHFLMRGFTLVELAIVLVIIGLLVGGVLAGQSLIKAAQIQSVVTDLNRFKTAFSAFQGKYGYLPGDIPNAERYFSCITDPLFASNVCSGNNNGSVGSWSTEGLRAWQHLALAGLVEGNFTGMSDTVANRLTPGINTPRSRMGGGYMIISESALT